MWRETNLFGIYLSPLLVYMLVATALFVPLRMLLARAGAFAWTWNAPLASAALYACILGVLVTWL